MTGGAEIIAVRGIDFTSVPSRRKPITCAHCRLTNSRLECVTLERWSRFQEFEDALLADGPWIAGLDFPFGQSRKFIENIGWPQDWREYVQHAHSLGRSGFRKALEDYRAPRLAGDKEHQRQSDRAARSISPQKLHGVPVALMFFEGAPRLVKANVTIPFLQTGDPARIVVEAYPGVLARKFAGSYKADEKKKQTAEHRAQREVLLQALSSAAFAQIYGFRVVADQSIIDDPTGDELDALLCAVQAAWAWESRDAGYGAPPVVDPLEGWIADPQCQTIR